MKECYIWLFWGVSNSTLRRAWCMVILWKNLQMPLPTMISSKNVLATKAHILLNQAHMFIIFCCCVVEILPRLPVYHQDESINLYLYQSGLPEMSEFTVCFWLYRESNSLPSDMFVVSIAVEGLWQWEIFIWTRWALEQSLVFIKCFRAWSKSELFAHVNFIAFCRFAYASA